MALLKCEIAGTGETLLNIIQRIGNELEQCGPLTPEQRAYLEALGQGIEIATQALTPQSDSEKALRKFIAANLPSLSGGQI